MPATCPHGHTDLYRDGTCRTCAHLWQAASRRKRKSAVEFCRELERAGVLDLGAGH
jgi:hypothetical protein